MYTKIGNIEFETYGKKALFTTPESKQNGHPISYQVPTFGAIRGLMGSIYRHKEPYNFDWHVEKIRIMNKIVMYPTTYVFSNKDSNIISTHTFLHDVRYQVKASMKFKDEYGPDTYKEHENAMVKYEMMFCRKIKCPHKIPCFGQQDCTAYSKIKRFGEGNGYYDNSGVIPLGNMFIQFEYLDEQKLGKRRAYYAEMNMVDGVIEIPNLNNCSYIDFSGSF